MDPVSASSNPSRALLVVEDDGPIRNLLTYNLRREGFVVTAAADGNEAIALAHGGYEAALVDLWMPGKDGFEVLDHFRRNHPEVPVVIVSAHAQEKDVAAIRAAGAFDFVSKPFRIAQLLEIVNAASRTRTAAKAGA